VHGQQLDGWVQLGAGFQVDVVGPRVVYDDMTVAQARRFPYTNWSAQRPAAVAWRMALQRAVYQSAVRCCMTSSWAASSALEDYGVPLDRIAVVGAGTHEPARSVRRDWATPRFLFVGFDWRRKNGERVVQAFTNVKAKYPGAELHLIGGHPPVEAAGVISHGILRRDQPVDRARMTDLFDQATCFVMPSLFEPAGVVFTEAAAAGLPSIGGSVGGSRDFIGDGGVVVEPTSTEEITTAMLRYCDPVEAAATGARAQARSPLFTWNAVAGRLVNALGLSTASGEAEPFLPFRR
jgi:glycosyltransferase involved in cell wall biosynthesis